MGTVHISFAQGGEKRVIMFVTLCTLYCFMPLFAILTSDSAVDHDSAQLLTASTNDAVQNFTNNSNVLGIFSFGSLALLIFPSLDLSKKKKIFPSLGFLKRVVNEEIHLAILIMIHDQVWPTKVSGTNLIE